MESVKYYNTRIIDAQGDFGGVVYTNDGIISYVGNRDPHLPYDRAVDLKGRALMPAFIDLHCHLRDPGFPKKETMETGMRAALAGGYAILCAMANTDPVIETPMQVTMNHNKADALQLCRLFQAAAAGKGLQDAIPTDWEALSRVTPMISNDGKTIINDAFMERLLIASQQYGFLISTHCQPERFTVARDLDLIKKVGGNLHVGHISRRETVEMLRRAKSAGLRITAEITPHHLIGYDSDYRVNPPLRTKADTEALTAAIVDGTADCLATDHAPHTPEDKAAGMAGISNIEYAMGVFLWVFNENHIPLTRFSQMASLNPAKLLGLSTGLIRSDYPADFVVVDLEHTGQIVPENMLSRSHNTPFAGHPLRGRVITTIIGGKVRYDYGSTV